MGARSGHKRGLLRGAPLYPMQAEGAQALSLRTLVKSRVFWLFMVMMLCAGASEQAVSQWSSAFAEQGLGVSKTVGDLAGPMAFAAMMGVSRLIFGKYGEKLNLNRYMAVCAALCVGAYLCIVFVPSPVLSLLGCAVCGFSVGIFWPGTFSRASASIREAERRCSRCWRWRVILAAREARRLRASSRTPAAERSAQASSPPSFSRF